MGKVRLSYRLKAKLKQRTRPYVRSRLFKDVFLSDDHYRETGVRAIDVENRPYVGESPVIMIAEKQTPMIRTSDFEQKIMPAAQVHTLLLDNEPAVRTYPEHTRGYER